MLDLAREHSDEIERRYPKVLRRVGGYNLDQFIHPSDPVNLSKIMVGSEGTLGVVLEAKLRLVPLPKAKAVMVIGFHDLLESLSASPTILKHNPSAVEVMDKSILDNTRQNLALNRIHSAIIQGDPAATLCVEFYADRKEDLPPRLRALEEDLRSKKLGYYYHAETDPAAQTRIWSLREAALGLSMAMKQDAKSISFVEDTAVAPEKLSAFIGRFLAIIQSHSTTAGVYAHASVGCLHVRPVINLKTEDGVSKFAGIADDSCGSGGGIRRRALRRTRRRPSPQPVHAQAFRRRPVRSISRNQTHFRSARHPESRQDRGLASSDIQPPLRRRLPTPESAYLVRFLGVRRRGGAIEMCSGVGRAARSFPAPCARPTWRRATNPPTTRGRANALRMAISGNSTKSA